MRINLTNDKDIFTILLLSDTHIYRANYHLPEFIMRAFRNAEPDVILHCGDICTLSFLDELRSIAPVYAVRGNREILNRYRIPAKIEMNIGRYRLYAEHGQGGLFSYLRTKVYLFVQKLSGVSPDYSHVVKTKKNFGNYDIYCFGHSHSRLLDKKDETILINPGHLNIRDQRQEHESPSFAVIILRADGVRVVINRIEDGDVKPDIHFFPE